MQLFAICTGTGRGQWGQVAPNFGAVWTVPPNRQPEQRSCYFVYFRFVFIGEKVKGWKIRGLKPMRKKSWAPAPPPAWKWFPRRWSRDLLGKVLWCHEKCTVCELRLSVVCNIAFVTGDWPCPWMMFTLDNAFGYRDCLRLICTPRLCWRRTSNA